MPQRQTIDDGLAIGEIERRSGVPASTLRYYERLGLLPPAPRLGGRRRYEPAVVERIGAVRLCIDAGFTLEETRLIFSDQRRPRRTWRELAERKIEELTRRITEAEACDLLVHGLDCPASDIVQCPYYRDQIAKRAHRARTGP